MNGYSGKLKSLACPYLQWERTGYKISLKASEKVRQFVRNYLQRRHSRYAPALFLFLSGLLILLAACGNESATPLPSGRSMLAARQVLIIPNVGAQEIGFLDPAQEPDPNNADQGPDPNSALAINMLYSGLVRSEKDFKIVPDQASWDISSDNKTYTFHLKTGITFSDGTPVTAQTYVYTLTRALLPEIKSPTATIFEGMIVGANEVNKGKSTTLSGVRALDNHTLQITLVHPVPYFLELLANPIYFPLNKQLIDLYGQVDWVNHAAGNGIGTGPFMLKEWDHNIKMILVPNPYYYGAKTKLKEADLIFVGDPTTAFQSYRAGQYNLDWNIAPADLATAANLPGFMTQPLLQTDLLFFNDTMPPFDQLAVRQAFAYATDKVTLAHVILQDAVVSAPTIIPPGMPGYQPNYAGLPYDKAKAKSILQTAYPDINQMPQVTFSYSDSQLPQSEAVALQQMWQTALGVQVKLLSVEPDAYNDEMAKDEIQFGFKQWNADFPDPYNWLAPNLLSMAPNNNGQWHNPTFDQIVMQAEQTSADARIALYNQAEQIAISDVAWLPLDHQTISAIIPPWIHGISLNGEGLFFGDWSNVYLLQH
jgi:oligopeptide transport system substrate-binding protein